MAKREIEFNKNRRYSDLWCECSADFVLPDFNSDVRKVLLFDATAYPSSAFPSADGLECTGIVTFDLVYINFDGEVESTSFNGDYNFKVKCPLDNFVDSFVDTKVSSVALRLLSPRKISAKAGLSSTVDCTVSDVQSTEGTALEEIFEPELQYATVKIRDTKFSEVFEREYAESVARFDDKTSDEVRVLYTHVEPVVEEATVDNGEVKIKGNLKATLLVKTDDAPMYKLEHSFAIDERIKMDALSEDSDATAKVDVASVSASIRGDDTGVDLVLNVICEMRLACDENKECTVLTDAYLCSCECENTYEDFDYNEYIKKVDETHAFAEKVPLGGLEHERLRDVVFTRVTPKIDGYELADGGVKIFGEMKVSAIATEIKDDETPEYTSLKFNTKFQENVNLDCQNQGNIEVYPDISVNDISCEADSDYIYLKLNEKISLQVTSPKRLQVLASANAKEDAKFEKNPSRITVYYPESGDTLYSVAKTFHTTKEKLLLDNSIALSTSTDGGEFSLAGVKNLIIT